MRTISRKTIYHAVILSLLMTSMANADSLFQASYAKKGTLIAKQNRFEVGDIITVLVQEKIDSSITANTNTKKESDVQSQAEAAANEFLTSSEPGGLKIMQKERLPNWDISAKNEHKARGQTNRVAQLKTSISCIVKSVNDNGNVTIEGEKTISMNREDCRLFVRGVVRSRDVTPGNTVLSTQIADAVVDLKGKGPLWNNQRRGLVTRVLDWFSPF